VFELNEGLRDWAYETTKDLVLNDTDVAKAYRAKYESVATYKAGAAGPCKFSDLKHSRRSFLMYYSRHQGRYNMLRCMVLRRIVLQHVWRVC
jgi:hypothetical protein